MDAERVDSGLPEDHAGAGRHSLATLALAVDFGQPLDIVRGRGGLADRDAQPDAHGSATAATCLHRQLNHDQLWSSALKGGVGDLID